MQPIRGIFTKILLDMTARVPEVCPQIDNGDILLCAHLFHLLRICSCHLKVTVELLRWFLRLLVGAPLLRVHRWWREEYDVRFGRVPLRQGVRDHANEPGYVRSVRGKRDVEPRAGERGVIRAEPNGQYAHLGDVLPLILRCEALQ